MLLTHPIFSKPIEFVENNIQILIIENPAFLSKFLCELLAQHKNKEGNFVLSKNFNPLPISKNIEIITDIFSININSRPIMTKLLDELKTKAHDEDFYIKTQEFKFLVSQYIENLLHESDYKLSFSEDLEIQNILKACEVEVENTPYSEENFSLLDFIVEYCDICTRLLKISCIVFVNLKSFLSKEEILLFYEEVMYKKYSILLIENHQAEDTIKIEKVRIIDKDLCEIILD